MLERERGEGSVVSVKCNPKGFVCGDGRRGGLRCCRMRRERDCKYNDRDEDPNVPPAGHRQLLSLTLLKLLNFQGEGRGPASLEEAPIQRSRR